MRRTILLQAAWDGRSSPAPAVSQIPRVHPRTLPVIASGGTRSCLAPKAAPIVLLGTESNLPFKNLSKSELFPTDELPKSTTFWSMEAGAGLRHWDIANVESA